MRAIAIQFGPDTDKTGNIGAARGLIDAALASGDRDDADPVLVSLPEMWTCLGGDRAKKLAESEVLPPPGGAVEPGSAYAFLSGTARRKGIYLHGGSIGERAGDRLFNTSLLFGPDGVERARYRKIHLFDITTPSGQGYRESALFEAGDAVVIAAGGDLCFGLSVCYDLRFPELYLRLRQAGADVLFVPSAFTVETGRDHWEVLLRARAIETQCYVVAAATCGQHRDGGGMPRETYGHSLICDPWGAVLGCRAEGDGWVEARLDKARLARVREAMPVLAHRRLA